MKTRFLAQTAQCISVIFVIVSVTGMVILSFMDEGKDIGGLLFLVWILIPLVIIIINSLVSLLFNLYLRDNFWKLLAGTLITTIPYSVTTIVFSITGVFNYIELNNDSLLLLILLGHLIASALGVSLVRHWKSLNQCS